MTILVQKFQTLITTTIRKNGTLLLFLLEQQQQQHQSKRISTTILASTPILRCVPTTTRSTSTTIRPPPVVVRYSNNNTTNNISSPPPPSSLLLLLSSQRQSSSSSSSLLLSQQFSTKGTTTSSNLTPNNMSLQIYDTIEQFRSVRRTFDPTKKIGFVPTMGALHEGHLSLIQKARTENDIIIVSIFVNPTQFNPNEDLSKYPRTIEQDLIQLQQLNVHHVFIPKDPTLLYKSNHITYVVPEGFEERTSEGQVRLGHFKGVATIVTKLFNIVQPTNVYFGQKDAAQCVVIYRLIQDLNIPVTMHIVPTIREPNGLAMSSRNTYLSPTEYEAASILYKSLCAAQSYYNTIKQEQQQTASSSSTIPSDALRKEVENVLRTEPLITEIQYISIDHRHTMLPIDTVLVVNRNNLPSDDSTVAGAILSIAVKIGTVRLIDNIILE